MKSALNYAKKKAYLHVIVEDEWYTKTPEYKAFLAGVDQGIEDAISHIGQPDHDAELLGYPDGEAPTTSSLLWKRVNAIK